MRRGQDAEIEDLDALVKHCERLLSGLAGDERLLDKEGYELIRSQSDWALPEWWVVAAHLREQGRELPLEPYEQAVEPHQRARPSGLADD